MLLEEILGNCNYRYMNGECGDCDKCSFYEFCLGNCEKCLKYIHFPQSLPEGAPARKYDCSRMADFYTCKYSYRYTSELIYALRNCIELCHHKKLKVLSFGCGPCTDLMAIDYLCSIGEISYNTIQYAGVDYSPDVWQFIHSDISNYFNCEDTRIKFIYSDMCKYIRELFDKKGSPNLIVFQYVFSDLHKHTGQINTEYFIKLFAEYFNSKVKPNTYIIINDVNLNCENGGGRDYFLKLYNQLSGCENDYYHFFDDNKKEGYYIGGYPYGRTYNVNHNLFYSQLHKMSYYSPYNTCASAQMVIKKVI